MIMLYQFTPLEASPCYSNFCAKVEFFLKVNNIEYKIKIGDPRKTPKNKLPLIIDGDISICDSEHIIQYLSKKHNIDLDKNLSSFEKAAAFGMSKMIEEYLYFIMLYSRWIDGDGAEKSKELFFSKMPFILKILIPKMIVKEMKKMLYFQGVGRHSHDEIVAFARESIQAISDFLGEKKYFMGNEITGLDIRAFPILYNLQRTEINSFINSIIAEYQNLKDYVLRIYNEYYVPNNSAI